MSADNETQKPAAEEPHHKSQVEVDEEIAQLQEHSRHQHAQITRPPEVPPAPPGKALTAAGVFLLLLALAGGLTMAQHAAHERALAKETEQAAVPTVAVMHASPQAPETELVLPGSLQAFVESPIFARTNGYLLRWTKDIGSRVKKGELLAVIDTPEVDQELNQARAARQQIASQLDLARISAERWENLRKTDSVSAQEADQQSSAFQQARANLAAADANVKRLEEMESFKNVYAPFSGVLTRRNVDPGALINSGSSGKELFDLAQVDTLRVYASVPQSYAPFIKPGSKAVITLQEYPGRKFEGVIKRTAEAIDPATRTLLTEVDVNNQDGALLPGSFGDVHFAVGGTVQRMTVPVNAMLFRAQGPQVAVVGANNHVELRALNIGRDYGTRLEVLAGIGLDEWIVMNPPDSLENGQEVHMTPLAPEKQPEVKPAQKGSKS